METAMNYLPFFCTDSITSSKYFDRAAQTGQPYSSTDLTMLQCTCTSRVIVRPLFFKRAQCLQTLVGLFDYVNTIQIADVALRVVFLLFLPFFKLLFRLGLTLETTSEMPTIFVFTTKTTQPRAQVFSVNGALTSRYAALLKSLVD